MSASIFAQSSVNTRQSPAKVLSWLTKTWLGTPALQDEVAHLLRTIARNREAIARTEFDIVSLQAETMLKENEHTQKKITAALLEGAKQDLLVRRSVLRLSCSIS